VRQRCCLHYKRRDGDLCGNCPRRQGAVSCSGGWCPGVDPGE